MEANDNTEASSPFSVSNLLFPVRENSPEIVGEDEKQGNGPRTPAECEEDKKIDSPIESPPILEKAEDAEVSDESTTAVASADESQDHEVVENPDLIDETLTSVPGLEEPPAVDNAKETIKRKLSDAVDEQTAKRPAPGDDKDVQEIGAVESPLVKGGKKTNDEDVVLLQEEETDDTKFKAPELPKEKGSNGKCKGTIDCNWDEHVN